MDFNAPALMIGLLLHIFIDPTQEELNKATFLIIYLYLSVRTIATTIINTLNSEYT